MRRLVVGVVGVVVVVVVVVVIWVTGSRRTSRDGEATTRSIETASHPARTRPAPGSQPERAALEEATDPRHVTDCAYLHGRRWCREHGEQLGRCAHGDPEACFQTGQLLWKQTGDAAALGMLIDACTRGLAAACSARDQMKRWSRYGYGADTDDATRVEVTTACTNGEAVACMEVGLRNHDTDSSALESACNGGIVDACMANSNFARTAAERLRWLRLACDTFEAANACFLVSVLYSDCDLGCGQEDPISKMLRNAPAEVGTRLGDAGLPSMTDLLAQTRRTYGDACDAPCPVPDPALAADYHARYCELCPGCGGC